MKEILNMQKIYKDVGFETIQRIVTWCREQLKVQGSFFEVYEDPAGINRFMVVVKPAPRGTAFETLNPLGTFFCNYIAPGVISLEDDPGEIQTESRKRDTFRLKQIIDLLLRDAQPGKNIDFRAIL